MNSGDATAVVRSYAKVNLTLDVLERRADGYHDIQSVMQSISLHDTLILHTRGDPGVRVMCEVPEIPTGEANLAYRAACLVFESRGITQGLDIRIEKRIPLEAGLGGGSSNAGAVLRGLNRLLRLSMGAAELSGLAARIGSDVPFFLVGGTAFVQGRGEDVLPLPDIRPWWLVIVKPPFGVSTTWAYSQLDEIRSAARGQPPAGRERGTGSERMRKCVEKQECIQLPELLSNDLEPPVIGRYQQIAEIKQALCVTGARSVLMCGSGSAVFGVYDDERLAEQARRAAGQDRCETFVARTTSRAEALKIY